jgi:hypothetical protein
MGGTLIARYTVADYAAWRRIYHELMPLRVEHGYTAQQVMHIPNNPNDVVAVHSFPTVAQAEAFADDPRLKAAMERAGVSGAPRIEIYEDV